jgi:arylformamidase
MELSQGWIDVSVTLTDGMVSWPDDPPVRIRRVSDVERGDEATLSELCMSAHTGTHMDAPRHFLAGGDGLDRMPLAATMGPARVIGIADPRTIGPEELERHNIRAGERVLFRTRNSERAWAREGFIEDFVAVSPDGARWLAERRVRTVGVDYLSVGGFHDDGAAVHRALLGAGVWIIEGLDLSAVSPGPHELICLPLRIVGADGAPARALLRPVGNDGKEVKDD